jgi:cell division protein FtsB
MARSDAAEVNAVKRLIVPVLIGLSVYFALFGGEYSIFEVRRVRAERVELEQRLVELERTNDCLRVWADALETDSATIERLARERYGMIRPGEVLYRITGPSDSAPTGSPAEGLDENGDAASDSAPKDSVPRDSVRDSACR